MCRSPLLIVLALLIQVCTLQAQGPTVRDVRPTCARCKIDVIRSLALGTASGPGIIEHAASKAFEDSKGRFFVLGSYGTEVKVFSPKGNFLRTFGRAGDGPGEYRGIGSMAIGTDDTLYLFDEVARRYTAVTADFALVRTVRLPFGPEPQSTRLADGLFIFNIALRTPERIGQPLHAIDAEGKFVRSFGSATGVYRPDIPYLLGRAITPADASHLWAAYRTEYAIELIDVESGRIQRRLERKVEWFPSRMVPAKNGEESQKPEPFIMGITKDSTGLLWVMIAVAGAHWERAVIQPKEPGDHFSISDDQVYFDTIIEVIDPRSAALLASVRLPQYFTHFVGGRFAAGVFDDADGSPRLELWQLKLVVP